MITIKHTHADGTLVYGTEKGDGVYELIGPRTAARFKYFRSIRMIGIAQSRDHLAKRWQIDQARKALEAAGHEVTVEQQQRGGDMRNANGQPMFTVTMNLDCGHTDSCGTWTQGTAEWLRGKAGQADACGQCLEAAYPLPLSDGRVSAIVAARHRTVVSVDVAPAQDVTGDDFVQDRHADLDPNAGEAEYA